MRLNTFFFVCLNLLCSSFLNAQSVNQEINEKMTKAYQKSGLPGLSLVMVNADGFLYQKSFGYADLDSKEPYENGTIQNIGSISKTLIGVSLMQLVEKGKLKLEDSINKYLPFPVTHPKYSPFGHPYFGFKRHTCQL